MPCNNYKSVEERVHNVLARFKDQRNSRKEMLHIRYDSLSDIIDFICDNYDKEINYINECCKIYFNNLVENDPIVPIPLCLDSVLEIKLVRNGRERVQSIDVSSMSDEEVDALIERIVNECAQRVKPEYELSRDKDLVELNLVWSSLSEQMKKYKGYSMTQWRELFKKWYKKYFPKQLKVKGIKH